jgi:integrase
VFTQACTLKYAAWYSRKVQGAEAGKWFVFPAGRPQPTDPTKPCTSFKTVWRQIKVDAGVAGRWHDNRHTFITGLAESGETSDQTIMDIAGHVSKRMLKHYSHIRMVGAEQPLRVSRLWSVNASERMLPSLLSVVSVRCL